MYTTLTDTGEYIKMFSRASSVPMLLREDLKPTAAVDDTCPPDLLR